MRPRCFVLILGSLLVIGTPGFPQGPDAKPAYGINLQAPAGTRPAKIDPTGETILPSGRLITPLGKQVNVAPHPYGLVLSPDGKTLVTVNSGTKPFSVSILTGLASRSPRWRKFLPASIPPMTIPRAFSWAPPIAPDNRTLYISEGDNGKIGIFDLVTHQRLDAFSLDGTYLGATYKDSLTGAILLTRDGRHLGAGPCAFPAGHCGYAVEADSLQPFRWGACRLVWRFPRMESAPTFPMWGCFSTRWCPATIPKIPGRQAWNSPRSVSPRPRREGRDRGGETDCRTGRSQRPRFEFGFRD